MSAESSRRKPAPDGLRQGGRQFLQSLRSILGSVRATLLVLHDVTSEQPVSHDTRRILIVSGHERAW